MLISRFSSPIGYREQDVRRAARSLARVITGDWRGGSLEGKALFEGEETGSGVGQREMLFVKYVLLVYLLGPTTLKLAVNRLQNYVFDLKNK